MNYDEWKTESPEDEQERLFGSENCRVARILPEDKANAVFLDPAPRDGSWAVFYSGRIVASGYNSKGAALAALTLYESGYRKRKDAK